MFGKNLENPRVLKLLSQVLNQPSTLYQKSPNSFNGEFKKYNFYSMLICIDAIMKYQIIVRSNTYFETFIHQLEILTQSYKDHQELVIGVNSLLGEMIRVQLGLPNLVEVENKRMVLKEIYHRYIVNGYCFHSFPSFFKEEVEANGIQPNNYQYPKEQMKKISYIFKNHHYRKFITKNLDEENPKFYLTDSPMMAYYYAISSPTYLCNMTATSPYMKGQSYDSFAYYRKDYKACRKNLERLGKHVHLSEKEHRVVSEAFKKQWKKLNIENSFPCIAVIERRAIGRNHLPDIEKIIEDSAEESFVISMAKITDSRYPDDGYTQPILSLDFNVEVLPQYKAIESGLFEEVSEKVEVVTPPLPQEVEDEKDVVEPSHLPQKVEEKIDEVEPSQLHQEIKEKKAPEIERLFTEEEESEIKKELQQQKKDEEKRTFLLKRKKKVEKEKKIPQEQPQPVLDEWLEIDGGEIEEEYLKPSTSFNQPVNEHGYADVFALCGLLCIMTGLTLILVFRYFGIR